MTTLISVHGDRFSRPFPGRATWRGRQLYQRPVVPKSGRSKRISGMHPSQGEPAVWHGTTILTVRKGGKVVVGGDGQVSIGQTVIKSNAKKVRKLGKGDVIGGFAGATADAFTLFERLESKLEQYPGQLTRAAVELAKDWRTDRYLRRLEAMMIVADKDVSLVLTGRRYVNVGATLASNMRWSAAISMNRRWINMSFRQMATISATSSVTT